MDSYVFAEHEKPTSAGSPYLPKMTTRRRVAYGMVGLLIGLLTTLPNALTNVNVGTIAGSLGLYAAEASWLPALYFGMNASANLTVVKARAQFGIPLICQGLLVLYALMAGLQLMWPSFATAAAARIANGVETGALTTLSAYYFLVSLPAKYRPMALLAAIGLTQFGTPLARLVPVELLSVDHWRGMHLLELAQPLVILTAILAAPLPPSDRVRTFETTDLVSIALLVPGVVLTCEVLGLGRTVWWHDTPWLGGLLAAAVLLLTAGVCIELNRQRPLLRLEWLSTTNILRFVGVALLMRLALAEQTFGSVGLLSSAGLNNDQLHTLFLLVAASMAAGLALALLTLSEARLPYQVIVAASCIAAAAILDSHSNNLTRPEQLYLSQSLIGFGTTLFIGPVIVYGYLQMVRKGRDHYITLVVLFSITQNVGALAGSALMGSYQIERTHAHRADLSAQLQFGAPAVSARQAGGAAALAPVLVDPALRGAESSALLAQSVGREAAVLAYNDVFALLAILAGGTAGAVTLFLFLNHLRQPSQKALS